MSHETPVYEAGEVIRVQEEALDQTHPNRYALVNLTGTASVYAPSKDPENNVSDRGSPDATASFAYIAGKGYIAYLDTTGLTPAGIWTLRTHLQSGDNDYDQVNYSDFELKV